LVGGDPLVRYREVEQLLPQLEARGVHTQLVTSAFRPIPTEWSRYKRLSKKHISEAEATERSPFKIL
jgi:pyruvate-formate lyase-activating enzyme